MTRRCRCRTAITGSKGNHPSRCTYNNGARDRASATPLSLASNPAGTAAGTGGMCARGPQADAPAKRGQPQLGGKVTKRYAG